MKTCIDCQQPKPFDAFVAKSSCKDGYEPRCRVCRSIKYNKSTPELLAKKIYHTQIANSIKRGHVLPEYTLSQLSDWMQLQPRFKTMYAAWQASGYAKDMAPSVDRQRDDLPYILSNLQLMIWTENRAKAAQCKKEGSLTANHRAVAAYNADGSLHKEYVSMSEAMREFGLTPKQSWGISSVANGTPVKDGRGKLYTPQTYKGFVWKWI